MSQNETEQYWRLFCIAHSSDKKFFLIIIPYICTMIYSLLERMLYCWCGQNVNISICSVFKRYRIGIDFIVWSAAGMMETNVVTQMFRGTGNTALVL